MITTIGTIQAPVKPSNIPTDAQWLGGEGAGCWFHLYKPVYAKNKEYRIKRFSPNGKLDCNNIFVLKNKKEFNMNMPYQFTYISHCQKCTIIQDKQVFVFEVGE